MLKLNYENMQKKVEISDEIIKNLTLSLEKTLEFEEFYDNAEISLSFVDNEEIKELNKETRNKDAVTDVLSFPLGCNGEYDINRETGAYMLGDIVISVEHAIAQAETYGHSLQREIAFLTVHSMLHLLGYDHEKGGLDEATMFEKQEQILRELGLAIVK